MVFLAALAVAAQPPLNASPLPTSAMRQARATVTILSAAPLRFHEIERSSPDQLRDTHVRATDGTMQPARLVEFQ